MNKIARQELERMNGVDPYEDELDDGVPSWLYAVLVVLLFLFGWLHR